MVTVVTLEGPRPPQAGGPAPGRSPVHGTRRSRARRAEERRGHGVPCGCGRPRRRRARAPNAEYSPPGRRQSEIVSAVPSDIGVELLAPPVPVCFRLGGVDRAPVPEAAVDEHEELRAREHDVGFASQTLDRGEVDAVAEASSVEFAAQGEFGAGIAASIGSHGRPGGGGRRGGAASRAWPYGCASVLTAGCPMSGRLRTVTDCVRHDRFIAYSGALISGRPHPSSSTCRRAGPR